MDRQIVRQYRSARVGCSLTLLAGSRARAGSPTGISVATRCYARASYAFTLRVVLVATFIPRSSCSSLDTSSCRDHPVGTSASSPPSLRRGRTTYRGPFSPPPGCSRGQTSLYLRRDDGVERGRESQHEERQLHLRRGGRYVDGTWVNVTQTCLLWYDTRRPLLPPGM